MRAILLGTSNAIPTPQADNTYFVLDLLGGPVLVDCGGSPGHRLLQLGLNPLRLQAVFLTHAHADHIYGLPVLVQHLWLARPEKELLVLGLEETLRVARSLTEDAFGMTEARIRWQPVPPESGYPAWEADGLILTSFPVRHVRPTLGLTIGGLTYSCDTAPSPEVVDAARGARVLIHEATVLEPSEGHSRLEDAARAAAQAGVEELVAIHLHPRWQEDEPGAAELVGRYFEGRFTIARPGLEIPLGSPV